MLSERRQGVILRTVLAGLRGSIQKWAERSFGPQLFSKTPSLICYLVLLGNFVWLLQSPPIGVADNGDFWRVARPAGIEHLDSRVQDGRFMDRHFRVERARIWSGGSSSSLLAYLAAKLGSSDGELDIRWMGALLMTFLILEVTVAIGPGLPASLVLLLLFVFLDSAYLPFFNSFYADSTLFVALIGITMWFSWLGSEHRKLTLPVLIPVLLLSFFGGASKVLYSVLPLVAGLTLLATVVVGGLTTSVKSSVAGFSILLATIVGLPTWFILGPGPDFPWVNGYHAVFACRLVPLSGPQTSRHSKGLFGIFPDATFFTRRGGEDHPVNQVLAGVSRWRIASQYLRDPRGLPRALDRVVDELSAARSHTRGTRERRGLHRSIPAPERRFFANSGCAAILASTMRLGSLFWLFTFVLIGYSLRARHGVFSACLFLSLWTLVGIVVVILGDGLVSIRQHLVQVSFPWISWLLSKLTM